MYTLSRKFSKSADHLSRSPLATGVCVARLAVSHSTSVGPENSYVQIDCKTGCGEKKILGIRSGTTLSVCHCSSSRGQSEAPATAHNSFYLSAGICFARQWESVFSCCNFFTIFVGNFPALVQYLFVAEVVVDPSSQLWTTRTGGGGGGGKQRRDPGGVSC